MAKKIVGKHTEKVVKGKKGQKPIKGKKADESSMEDSIDNEIVENNQGPLLAVTDQNIDYVKNIIMQKMRNEIKSCEQDNSEMQGSKFVRIFLAGTRLTNDLQANTSGTISAIILIDIAGCNLVQGYKESTEKSRNKVVKICLEDPPLYFPENVVNNFRNKFKGYKENDIPDDEQLQIMQEIITKWACTLRSQQSPHIPQEEDQRKTIYRVSL